MIHPSDYTHHTRGGLWLDRVLDDRGAWSVDASGNLSWRNGAAVVSFSEAEHDTRLISHSPSVPAEWCYGDALALHRRCVELRKALQ